MQDSLYREIAENEALRHLSNLFPINGFFSGLIRHKYETTQAYYKTCWLTQPRIKDLLNTLHDNADFSERYNHCSSQVKLPDYKEAIDHLKREFDVLYAGTTPVKGFKRYDDYFYVLSNLNTEMRHHTGRFFTGVLLNQLRSTPEDERAFIKFLAQLSPQERVIFNDLFFSALIEENKLQSNSFEQESDENAAEFTTLLQAYLIAEMKFFKVLPQTIQDSLWENKSVLCAELIGMLVLLHPHLATAGGAAFIVKKLIGCGAPGELNPEDSPLKTLAKAGCFLDEAQEVKYFTIGTTITKMKRQLGLTGTEDRVTLVNHGIPNTLVPELGLVVDHLIRQIHRQSTDID